MGTTHRVSLAGVDTAVYQGEPEGSGPWPGVVILHEAYGLNEDIVRIADRFARAGYAAAAPDLVEGGRVTCLVRAFRDLQRGDGPLVERARAAVEWLAGRPDVVDDRIGVAGFCLGGGFALLLATGPGVGVVAANYGRAPSDERIADMCPVVASYGKRDRVFKDHARRLAAGLTRAGIDHDVKVYPDAGHSFMNDPEGHRIAEALGTPLLHGGYRAVEAEDAWRRILAFFAEHL